MVKVNVENGYYLFKLDDLLNADNISKNKLMRDTNTDFKVLQRIINGEIPCYKIAENDKSRR